MKSLLILVALFVGLVTWAQTQPPKTSTPPPPRKQQREAFREDITRLMKEKNVACKAASDCVAVAIGSRPCGGPSEYVMMSKGTKSKMGSDLTDLTKAIEELDQSANKDSGMASICSILEEPKMACRDGSCIGG